VCLLLQARLYSLQSDPATYCNEPDGTVGLGGAAKLALAWGLWAVLKCPEPVASRPAGLAVAGITVCGEQICLLLWGLVWTGNLLGQFKLPLQQVPRGLVLTRGPMAWGGHRDPGVPPPLPLARPAELAHSTFPVKLPKAVPALSVPRTVIPVLVLCRPR